MQTTCCDVLDEWQISGQLGKLRGGQPVPDESPSLRHTQGVELLVHTTHDLLYSALEMSSSAASHPATLLTASRG